MPRDPLLSGESAETFASLPRGHFGAIYADPPWKFEHWGKTTIAGRDTEKHYAVQPLEQIKAMPVAELAADDCVLFLWATWPMLLFAIDLIPAWGFTYKSCAFSWTKADARQMEFFRDDVTPDMRLGYWTRANNEPCLLATRGKPQRQDAGVRQAIIEPRRQHSRKPDCIYERIERLVPGPYLELFARTERPGWTVWGNQTNRFGTAA